MRIVILTTAEPGLRWFKRYYREHPQLNAKKTFAAFEAAKQRLLQNPEAGHRFADFEVVRELSIARSPFSLLYTFQRDAIFIIDVRDQRGLRSADALRRFNAELRSRYNLT